MFSFPVVILISTIFVCLSVVIVIIYLRWYFNYWTRRHVAGPQPQLLSGTFPKTYKGECNLIEELHEIYLQYKTKNNFVGIFTARCPKLFILEPKLATQILTQHFKCFRDNESSQWTSPDIEQMRLCSPFVSTGETWKERRAELVPALTANRLRANYPAMRDCAAKLVKFVASNATQPLDAKDLANRFTAEFIANFIWGIEAQAFEHASEPATIQQMANSMIAQALRCVRHYGRTAAWPWLRRWRPVRFFPATSDRFFQQLADEAVQMRAKSSPSSSSSKQRCDVINHLLQLKDKKSLNDIQIAGHTTTVLIDGFETGAIVIAHCLLLLSRNARVQQKLRVELDEAGVDVSYDALNELPYLDQCLQETLRLFPPLPTLFKLCTEAISLSNFDRTELTLQPNDVVYISSYSLQRDPDYYVNPEEFWPERFDAELGGVRKYRDMGVFLPFGDGPRICPGMKLGLAEAKVAVAEVVRHFQLKCGTKTRKDNKIAADSFLLMLDGGIELVFEEI